LDGGGEQLQVKGLNFLWAVRTTYKCSTDAIIFQTLPTAPSTSSRLSSLALDGHLPWSFITSRNKLVTDHGHCHISIQPRLSSRRSHTIITFVILMSHINARLVIKTVTTT
jgi:hypothetical protein